MFLKVGLKDIFVGMWQRRLYIVCVAALAVVLAVGQVFLVRPDGTISLSPDPSALERPVSCTQTLYVSSTMEDNYIDSYDQVAKIRNILLSLLKSEAYPAYLQENVSAEAELSTYLIPISNKEYTGSVQDTNIVDIARSIQFDSSGDNATIRISFSCTDSDIATSIMDATIRYVMQMDEFLKNGQIAELSRNLFESDAQKSEEDTSSMVSVSRKTQLKDCIQKAVIYIILLEAVYCVAAAAVMMLRPVLNEREDFMYFGVDTVWEV